MTSLRMEAGSWEESATAVAMAVGPIRGFAAMIRVVEVSFKYVFLGLATLVCITACSQSLELMLYNNASGPVEVHLSGKDILIGAGLSARFKYPATSEEWTLRMS